MQVQENRPSGAVRRGGKLSNRPAWHRLCVLRGGYISALLVSITVLPLALDERMK